MREPGNGRGGDPTKPSYATPRAEDFDPSATAYEADYLPSADIHVVPKPSPSKPTGARYSGGYWAELSSFPSTAGPPGSSTAEAGTTTQPVLSDGHRVGVPHASLYALNAWFNPVSERIQRSYSAGDIGVALYRSLTDYGCRILTTWLCA